MKSSRVKLPIPFVVTISIFGFVFLALFYTDTSRFYLQLKSCYRKNVATKSKDAARTDEHSQKNSEIEMDDRFVFDPEECSVNTGKWVFNKSMKPVYTDQTCPFIDLQFSCAKNGRHDSDYRHWEWQPDDCTLPRFDPEIALKKLQGKRLMFVGDSLQRNQWESFVCMIQGIIPHDKKLMQRRAIHSVFTIKEYDATVEFYWAPYLIESNTDLNIILDTKKRILRVNSIENHAKNWRGVDILVFNTYVWWMSGLRLKTLWGTFANGEDGYLELDTPIAYEVGLKTWANWIDSNINPNNTRVFFTTMSPTHTRSADWDKPEGLKCFNETTPITKNNYWGTGSDKTMMSVLENVVKKMKLPVTFINITQLSEYRIDAHSSIFTENGGNLLTKQQKADPLHHADCIHWCLPGVPDTWNQIFLAYL